MKNLDGILVNTNIDTTKTSIRALDIAERRSIIENAWQRGSIDDTGYRVEMEQIDATLRNDPRLEDEIARLGWDTTHRGIVEVMRKASYEQPAYLTPSDFRKLAMAGILGYPVASSRRGFLDTLVNSLSHGDKLYRLGVTASGLLILEACRNRITGPNGGGGTTPEGYVSFRNVLQGLIRNTHVSGKLKLYNTNSVQSGNVIEGSEVAVVDFSGGFVHFNPDPANPVHKIKPGNYVAVLESTDGTFYKRITPVKVTSMGISVVVNDDIEVDNPDRNEKFARGERPLDVIEADHISGYRLSDYQILGLRGPVSNRWGARPAQDVYDTLWEATGDARVRRVDTSKIEPEKLDKLRFTVGESIKSLLDIINGDPAKLRESDIYYNSNGLYQPQLRQGDGLQDPNDSSGNRIVYVPVINLGGPAILEADDQTNGKMSFALLWFDANRHITGAFRVDTSRAMGLEPKRGLPVVGLDNQLLPIVKEYVSRILYNRMFWHRSTQETPDRQGV